MRFRKEQLFDSLLELYHLPKGTTQQAFLEVFLKTGEYVSRVKNFRRAQQMKTNWRKHRFSYRSGIERFHRNSGMDVQGLAKEMKKGLEKTTEGVKFKTTDYLVWDLVEQLTRLQLGITQEATYFALEEKYVEFSLFAESALKSLARLVECVISGEEVSQESVELGLAVIIEGLQSKLSEGKVILEEDTALSILEKLQL